jgi:hypothetical protein
MYYEVSKTLSANGLYERSESREVELGKFLSHLSRTVNCALLMYCAEHEHTSRESRMTMLLMTCQA